MKLFNSISRKFIRTKGNAVVGTANTIARQYLKMKEMFPDKEDRDIYREMVEFRYKLLPIPKDKYDHLYFNCFYSKSLKDFIMLILFSETELLECGGDFIEEVEKAIEEELEKYN